MSSYRDEARCALESSAARRAQNQYLKQIKDHHPALRRLDDVEDLLDVLREPGADASAKDALLLALLQEHQRAGGGAAFALLAVAMFPALDHIYRARLHRVREPDDLWGCVVGAFSEAIDRYPTDRRPTRVAANIEGDTMASLRRDGLREVRATLARDLLYEATEPYLDEIVAVDPEADPSQRIGLGDFEKPCAEKPADPEPGELEAARAAVATLFDATGILPEDRFLILGVHLYGRTLADLAVELGISREAAKKRHVRALTRMRKSRSGDGQGES